LVDAVKEENGNKFWELQTVNSDITKDEKTNLRETLYNKVGNSINPLLVLIPFFGNRDFMIYRDLFDGLKLFPDLTTLGGITGRAIPSLSILVAGGAARLGVLTTELTAGVEGTATTEAEETEEEAELGKQTLRVVSGVATAIPPKGHTDGSASEKGIRRSCHDCQF